MIGKLAEMAKKLSLLIILGIIAVALFITILVFIIHP